MFQEVNVKADTWLYIFYLFIMLEINFISDSSQPTFFFLKNIIGSWLNPDAVLSDWCSHFGPFLVYLYYLRPLALLI